MTAMPMQPIETDSDITLPPLSDLPESEFDLTHGYRDDAMQKYAIAYATKAVLADRAGRLPVAHWISVTDRLPEQWEDVMVWPLPNDHCPHAAYCPPLGWLHSDNVEFGISRPICNPNPTHWMPLPVGPAPADAKEAP